MIIDFHTHVFPEKIAERTISYLAEKSGAVPGFNGTHQGLLSVMEGSGIDLAIALPVLTTPKQFDSVNRFAAELNGLYRDAPRRILSFAGIHPACENLEGKMAWIKENGFLGVKIHPDYQGTFIDDPAYVRILQAARDLDLTVVTHAGVDAGFPDEPVRCTPDRAKNLIRKAPHAKLVFAHLGANRMYEEVIDTLCGEDVYFDTAHVLSSVSRETFFRILEKHGAERILFATDAPWSNAERDVNLIKSYRLNRETEEKIFFRNAKKILGI